MDKTDKKEIWKSKLYIDSIFSYVENHDYPFAIMDKKSLDETEFENILFEKLHYGGCLTFQGTTKTGTEEFIVIFPGRFYNIELFKNNMVYLYKKFNRQFLMFLEQGKTTIRTANHNVRKIYDAFTFENFLEFLSIYIKTNYKFEIVPRENRQFGNDIVHADKDQAQEHLIENMISFSKRPQNWINAGSWNSVRHLYMVDIKVIEDITIVNDGSINVPSNLGNDSVWFKIGNKKVTFKN